MLQRIKATYFYQKLFSHTDEKIKLDLVKHNKSLQKILDISLIDYRILSGKYIIYEGERIGKIYNAYNDKILFEGEFLKGKKNGKWKGYDDYGNIISIEEYSNGKKILKEKEIKEGFEYQYNNKHQLLYEGEFLNGKREKEKNMIIMVI